MSVPVHLRIFSLDDVRRTQSPSLDAFRLFRKLPPEFRQQIWRTALLAQRIVRLKVIPRDWVNYMMKEQGDATARLEPPPDETYGVVDENVPALSSVFHVNRESRDVALSHYRIHLPCWRLTRRNTSAQNFRRFVFYLNPEYDFLRIEAHFGTLVDFIHDMKGKHDPRHVGILNLVVDSGLLHGPNELRSIIPNSLEAPQRMSFQETIFQLREIFFIHEQTAGRLNLGFHTAPPTCDYRFNRALPANALTMGFVRQGPDPRPIHEYLKNVFVSGRPSEGVRLWNNYVQEHYGSLGTANSMFHCLDNNVEPRQ
ncbi:hypothetical protein GGR57DRAFT_479471 [Xylariaceae sp. FL1272]|nr:hypothetical protein GGR57DRAFT_479471 [Xylariaceae sp. FL1272]